MHAVAKKAVKAARPAKETAKQPERQWAPPALSSYQDKPMLVLNPDARFPFQFGLGKAKMLLEHIETVKAFVKSEGTKLK